jgi:hypothetical protein
LERSETSRRSKFIRLAESVQTLLVRLADPYTHVGDPHPLPSTRFDWNPSRRSRAAQVALSLLDHEDATLISQLVERTQYPEAVLSSFFLEFARTKEDLIFFEDLLRSNKSILANIVVEEGADKLRRECAIARRAAEEVPRRSPREEAASFFCLSSLLPPSNRRAVPEAVQRQRDAERSRREEPLSEREAFFM